MAHKTIFDQTNDSILLDIEGLKSALQCGRVTAVKIAKEANAEIRAGRRVLYSRRKIEAYLENVSEL